MRYGTTNYALSAALTIANTTDEQSLLSNVLKSNTLEAFKATQSGGTVTLTIELASAQSIRLVAIAGITGVVGNVTVTFKLATVTVSGVVSEVITPVQQTYLVAALDAETSVDEVVIEFDTAAGAGEFELGYLFVGPLSARVDPYKDSIQPAIQAADPTILSRAGVPITSVTFVVQSLSVTLSAKPYLELRALMADIYTRGHGTPLFWYFDDACSFGGEVMLAILDSDKVSFDLQRKQGSTDDPATTTIGLLEVF